MRQMTGGRVRQGAQRRVMVPVASAASCSTDRTADSAIRACGRTRSPSEATLTAGTNSAAEKAAFIAATDELLSDLLGPLPRSGVALHELHPESYGYNGVTQFDYYRRAFDYYRRAMDAPHTPAAPAAPAAR